MRMGTSQGNIALIVDAQTSTLQSIDNTVTDGCISVCDVQNEIDEAIRWLIHITNDVGT